MHSRSIGHVLQPRLLPMGADTSLAGGAIEALEETWNPRTIVIVEFPTIEKARAWYRSSEYALALGVRDVALSRNLILVDGIHDDGLGAAEVFDICK
jgi:uncharacterized protein (DUF1330 family)